LWDRLGELRRRRPREEARPTGPTDEVAVTRQDGGAAPAHPLERELVEVLLAEPGLVAKAKAVLSADEVEHPGLRRIVEEMYDLVAHGMLPDLDVVRLRLIDKPKLADFALRAQEVGLKYSASMRPEWLGRILKGFRDRHAGRAAEEVKGQLKSVSDHAEAIDLLRKLQQRRPEESVPAKAS
jgi:DNA primase